MKVGVLALQGDVEEHEYAIRRAADELKINVDVVRVKKAEHLNGLNALVIPGGESTTIGSLARRNGLLDRLRGLTINGLPMLGTCAGAYSWPGRSGTPWLVRLVSQYSVSWI